VQFGGRLIGGCIDTLMHTAGTPFGDVRSFIAANADNGGSLLYLENSGLSPTGWVRALHGLHWAGWLDGINGLLIGRSAAPDNNGPLELRYADAPQMVLINGALAQVQWTASGGGQVAQHLT
jgi:muramoyltetrapeptide carboxypeptidase